MIALVQECKVQTHSLFPNFIQFHPVSQAEHTNKPSLMFQIPSFRQPSTLKIPSWKGPSALLYEVPTSAIQEEEEATNINLVHLAMEKYRLEQKRIEQESTFPYESLNVLTNQLPCLVKNDKNV